MQFKFTWKGPGVGMPGLLLTIFLLTVIGPIQPGPAMVIGTHEVLLARLVSPGVPGLLPCDTVAQFLKVPHCGIVKETRMVPDWLGPRGVLALQLIGILLISCAPGLQEGSREPPAPVKFTGSPPVIVSVNLSGKANDPGP